MNDRTLVSKLVSRPRAPLSKRTALLLAVLGAACLAASPALAQAPAAASKARAEELFQAGRELLRQSNYAAACEKFAQSRELDPAPGTLLNLADCEEKAGKLATALGVYQELLPKAQQLGQSDRVAFARERIAVLEQRVARLTLVPSTTATGSAPRIRLDGKEVPAASVGAALPVDRGTHSISAEADGSAPWSGSLEISSDGQAARVEIPALVATAPRTVVESEPSPSASAPSEPKVASRPALYIAGAATGLCLAGTAVFGSLALRSAARFEEANRNPARTPEERRDLRSSASSLATVSSVLGLATLAGAGVTTFLWLRRDGASPGEAAQRTHRVAWTPWFGDSSAGLSVSGEL